MSGWKSAEQRKAYYKANREKAYNWRKSWKEANPEKVLESHKIYYQKHAEQERIRVSAWKKTNPDKVNAYKVTRRATKNKANDIHTADDKWMLKEMYSLAKLREVPEYWNLSKGNRNTDLFISATNGEQDDKDSK